MPGPAFRSASATYRPVPRPAPAALPVRRASPGARESLAMTGLGPASPTAGGAGVLRPATLSDLQAVHAIHFDPLVLPGLHQPPMSVSRFRSLFTRQLTLGHLFVYERAGELVGFCMASRHEGRAAHVARIEGFAVLPVVQGTGVAGAMMQAVLAALYREGVRRLEVAVDSGNPCALRFLARLGFASEGTLRGYLASTTIQPFADACLLARALGGGPEASAAG